MAVRKSISKKTRFEVFKRDHFTCQYCGSIAPNVVLEVDHIHPVAEGGKNIMSNLITSCFECNRGKGKIKLSDETVAKIESEAIQALAQRREQLGFLRKWRDELIQNSQSEVDIVVETISMAQSGGYLNINREKIKKIKELIRRFGLEETIISCNLAFEIYDNDNNAFEKIGGIAYNRKNNLWKNNGY